MNAIKSRSHMYLFPSIKCAFLYLLLFVTVNACSNKKNDRLTGKTWKVDQAILETNDSFFNDSLFKKSIIQSYEKREYQFDANGRFTISDGTTNISGNWTNGKNDDNRLTADMAKNTEIVVMKGQPGFAETWVPRKGATSIFTDYFGEDRIHVSVLPADESGKLILILRRK